MGKHYFRLVTVASILCSPAAIAQDAKPAFELDLKAPAPTIAVNLTASELAAIQNMCGVLQIQGVDGMRTVISIDDKAIAATKALKEKGGGDDNNRPKP